MVAALIRLLLPCRSIAQIILTINIDEPAPSVTVDQRVYVIKNHKPQGFGANHNAAFQLCNQPYFCPLNPDIKIYGDIFYELVKVLQNLPSSAVIAPLVLSPKGKIENSIRHFPTLRCLFKKAIGKDDSHYLVTPGDPIFFPEWIAGMFMLFRSENFKRLGGFDEQFFLYYEDVDICARVWQSAMKVAACPSFTVVHDARRDSHRKFNYFLWHLTSLVRFLGKHWGRLPHVD